MVISDTDIYGNSVIGSVITNNVSITGSLADYTSSNNSYDVGFTMKANVDLRLTKSVTGDFYSGGTLVYTILYGNNTHTPITDITITDYLSAGMEVSSTLPAYTDNTNNVITRT